MIDKLINILNKHGLSLYSINNIAFMIDVPLHELVHIYPTKLDMLKHVYSEVIERFVNEIKIENTQDISPIQQVVMVVDAYKANEYNFIWNIAKDIYEGDKSYYSELMFYMKNSLKSLIFPVLLKAKEMNQLKECFDLEYFVDLYVMNIISFGTTKVLAENYTEKEVNLMITTNFMYALFNTENLKKWNVID